MDATLLRDKGSGKEGQVLETIHTVQCAGHALRAKTLLGLPYAMCKDLVGPIFRNVQRPFWAFLPQRHLKVLALEVVYLLKTIRACIVKMTQWTSYGYFKDLYHAPES